MRQWLFIITLSGFAPAVFGQEPKPQLSLFYAVDEAASQKNEARLDSLITGLKARTIYLELKAYADFLGDPAYNMALSQKRLNAVQAYLSVKYPGSVNVLSGKSLGESFSKDNASKQGEPAQRRVDVFLNRVTPVDEVDTRPVKIEAPVDPPAVTPESEPEVTELGVLEKGKSITLEGLNFIPGRHKITSGSEPVLEKLLRTMLESPGLKIEIQGHVCCPDGEFDGLDYDTGERKLSHNRAKAVYDYLVQNGVKAGRLRYRGYGHQRPKIDPERSPADEQVNRRVEILVLE